MSKIQVTNPALFNSKKVEVETSALFVGDYEAGGNVDIVFEEDGSQQWIAASGQFGLKDYESEFGFVFKA